MARRYQSRKDQQTKGILLAFVVAGGVGWLAAPIVNPNLLPATKTPEEIAAVERSVYYHNCNDARAAGAAPIYRGQPGYREGMDGDSDGIACEPYR